MDQIKILFLGTPDFAASCLQVLISNPQFKIKAVLTRPDKPAGRNLKLSPSSVRVLAEQNSISVFTPLSFKDQPSMEFVRSLGVEAVVVSAYGVILPAYFLNWFPGRTVNLHPSLLPKWRGASPVQYSLLHGDKIGGVTLQKVSQKMDAGDIIHQISFPILDSMSAVDVLNKAKDASAELLCKYLPLYIKGKVKPRPQDEKKASYSYKIKKEDLKINWKAKARSVFNHIRAFSNSGGAYTFYENKRLKIFKCELGASSLEGGLPGQILRINPGMEIACENGSVFLTEVQWGGKKRQNIKEFIKGFRFKNSAVLS